MGLTLDGFWLWEVKDMQRGGRLGEALPQCITGRARSQEGYQTNGIKR